MDKARNWLYTLVFSLYCFIISIFTWWILRTWFPVYLIQNDSFNNDQLIRVFSVFCGIIFFSFIGASYTVYGQLSQTSTQSSSNKRFKYRDRGNSRYQRPSGRSKSRNQVPLSRENRSRANVSPNHSDSRARTRRPQMRP